MTVEPLDADTVGRLMLARFTYFPVGGTATLDHAPGGYHWMRRSAPVGLPFEEASEVLMTWGVHTRAGLRVQASTPRVVPDAVVVLGIAVGVFTLPGVTIPCRVVRVIEEPDRVGFTYGTLPGHPESGEEEFVVSRHGDEVTFTITAFSRPETRLARALRPVASAAQVLYTWRYLAALAG